MARSLTVKHEETPGTNPLLTGFLVIAALVLLGNALEGAFTDSASAHPPQANVVQAR
jgi:hypothetical protein